MSQQDTNSDSFSPNGCGCLLLLMSIVVIGANILPPFLNSSNKSKQNVAKMYVQATSKAQQAYFADKNGFATSIAALEVDIKTQPANYNYLSVTNKKSAFIYGVSKQKELKSCVGGVFVVSAKKSNSNTTKKKIKTVSILCENEERGTIKPAEPTYENGNLVCGKGTTEVAKSSN